MPSPAPSLLTEHLDHQPVLTSPYAEPTRHWRTDAEGVAIDELELQRRQPHKPIPLPAVAARQAGLDFDEALEAKPDDSFVADVRRAVGDWRNAGWPGATHATRQLLEYWARPPGEGPVHSLFFAQREAIETLVYLTEVGNGSHSAVRHLKQLGEDWSRGITRLAIRMATGTGKTTVMACLIAWYAVNARCEHRGDARGLARNVHRVIVICPGRTIRSQLERLNPRVDDNLYTTGRLLPRRLLRQLSSIRVDVLNYEKLQPKDGSGHFDALGAGAQAGSMTRAKLHDLVRDHADLQQETFTDMWDRLLSPAIRRETKERVVVINDEGHHCWERKDPNEGGVWASALHGLAKHPRLDFKQVVDLSATPHVHQSKQDARPSPDKSPTPRSVGDQRVRPGRVHGSRLGQDSAAPCPDQPRGCRRFPEPVRGQ